MSFTSHHKLENLLPVLFLENGCHFFSKIPFAAVMLAIDDLDELSADQSFLDTWLAPTEQQKFASFKLPKRQKEWLAGRICAKLAVQKLDSPLVAASPNRVIVVNDESGRPALFLDKTSFPGLEISVSHSGDFAIALIAENYCGVDIQERRDTLLRVKERFCTETDERILTAALASVPGLVELNLLWTVKEAIRKTLSHHHIPDFLKINLDQVERLNSTSFAFHCNYQHHRLTAICGLHESYALAFCILPG